MSELAKFVKASQKSAKESVSSNKKPESFSELKAEMYGISAFLVAESWKLVQTWITEHPDQVYVKTGNIYTTQLEVHAGTVMDQAKFFSGCEADVELFVAKLQETTQLLFATALRQTVPKVLNGEVVPGPDDKINAATQRLDDLHRVEIEGGNRFRLNPTPFEFIKRGLTTTAAIMPSLLPAAILRFYQATSRYPQEEEMQVLIKQLEDRVLEMANLHISELSKLSDAMWPVSGDPNMNTHYLGGEPDPEPSALRGVFKLLQVDDMCQVTIPTLERLIQKREDPHLYTKDGDEPHIRCLALFAGGNKVNVIREAWQYTASLAASVKITESALDDILHAYGG